MAVSKSIAVKSRLITGSGLIGWTVLSSPNSAGSNAGVSPSRPPGMYVHRLTRSPSVASHAVQVRITWFATARVTAEACQPPMPAWSKGAGTGGRFGSIKSDLPGLARYSSNAAMMVACAAVVCLASIARSLGSTSQPMRSGCSRGVRSVKHDVPVADHAQRPARCCVVAQLEDDGIRMASIGRPSADVSHTVRVLSRAECLSWRNRALNLHNEKRLLIAFYQRSQQVSGAKSQTAAGTRSRSEPSMGLRAPAPTRNGSKWGKNGE